MKKGLSHIFNLRNFTNVALMSLTLLSSFQANALENIEPAPESGNDTSLSVDAPASGFDLSSLESVLYLSSNALENMQAEIDNLEAGGSGANSFLNKVGASTKNDDFYYNFMSERLPGAIESYKALTQKVFDIDCSNPTSENAFTMKDLTQSQADTLLKDASALMKEVNYLKEVGYNIAPKATTSYKPVEEGFLTCKDISVQKPSMIGL